MQLSVSLRQKNPSYTQVGRVFALTCWGAILEFAAFPSLPKLGEK